MKAYLLWIPLTIIYNTLVCWASTKCNQTDFWRMYWYMTAIGMAVPTWSVAAYYSKNLIFDSLLYDAILVISSPIALYFLGQASNFTPMAWMGVAVTLSGLAIVKYFS